MSVGPKEMQTYNLLRDGAWHSSQELVTKVSHRFGGYLHTLKHDHGVEWENRLDPRRPKGAAWYQYRLKKKEARVLPREQVEYMATFERSDLIHEVEANPDGAADQLNEHATQLLATMDALTTERRHVQEQIDDKHRILREYDTVLQAKRVALATAEARIEAALAECGSSTLTAAILRGERDE